MTLLMFAALLLSSAVKVAEPAASLNGCEMKLVPCSVSAQTINRVWPGKQREVYRAKRAWFVNLTAFATPATLRIASLPGVFIRGSRRRAASADTPPSPACAPRRRRRPVAPRLAQLDTPPPFPLLANLLAPSA